MTTERIPSDVLLHIAVYIHGSDIGRMMMVNKEWNVLISNSNAFWSQVYSRERKFPVHSLDIDWKKRTLEEVYWRIWVINVMPQKLEWIKVSEPLLEPIT
jgi:hypothetical protein